MKENTQNYFRLNRRTAMASFVLCVAVPGLVFWGCQKYQVLCLTKNTFEMRGKKRGQSYYTPK